MDGDASNLELDGLVAAEGAAREARDDVDRGPFRERAEEVVASEGDRVEDVGIPPEGQLGVPALRRTDPRHGQAVDRDEHLGVTGSCWLETREVAQERVIDGVRTEREVDRERATGVLFVPVSGVAFRRR